MSICIQKLKKELEKANEKIESLENDIKSLSYTLQFISPISKYERSIITSIEPSTGINIYENLLHYSQPIRVLNKLYLNEEKYTLSFRLMIGLKSEANHSEYEKLILNVNQPSIGVYFYDIGEPLGLIHIFDENYNFVTEILINNDNTQINTIEKLPYTMEFTFPINNYLLKNYNIHIDFKFKIKKKESQTLKIIEKDVYCNNAPCKNLLGYTCGPSWFGQECRCVTESHVWTNGSCTNGN